MERVFVQLVPLARQLVDGQTAHDLLHECVFLHCIFLGMWPDRSMQFVAHPMPTTRERLRPGDLSSQPSEPPA